MANSSTGSTTQVLADSSLSRRLDFWTQGLLDLSKRNRLLYFKPQPNNTIKLVEPDLGAIWQRLIVNNKVHSFYGLEAEADLFDEEEEGDAHPTPQRPIRRDELRTDPAGTRLGKTLLYLRGRGRSSVEEQGVVTLFVTFGLVKWNDVAKDGKIGEDIFSPLLLVPVSLQRESTRAPYTLHLWEDEVILNPALKFRLANDFKVSLPEPGDIDDLNLAVYFQQAAAVIAKQPGWMLQEQSFLGLFSFHKIAMYRDLCDHRQYALSHGLVRALAGDHNALPDVPDDLPLGADLDDIPFHDSWQVLDADSSQQEAIAAARRGVSFVLQGPPGTGKSQTITNIIADCLANGKKVLFVSEKMAALQVVHSRLSNNGLKDFCLEAHSHKSNKREVIQELYRTLRAGRPTLVPSSDVADELTLLRKGLNDYAQDLHECRQPSGLSVYEAASHFSRLHHALELPFSLNEPLQFSPSQRSRITSYLREIMLLHAVLEKHETHPWLGTALRESDLQKRDEIQDRFTRLAKSLSGIDTEIREVLGALGLTRFLSLHTAKRVLELAESLVASPLPPRKWLDDRDTPALRRKISEWQSRSSAYKSRRANFIASRGADCLAMSRSELYQRLNNTHQGVLRRVVNSASDTDGDAALALRSELLTGLGETVPLLSELELKFDALSRTLHSTLEPTLSNAIALADFAALVARDPRPQPHWFEDGALTRLEQSVRLAHSNQVKIQAAQLSLAAYDVEKLLSLDVQGLISRFSGEYQQAQATLDTRLRPELEKLASFTFDSAPLTYHQAVSDIKVATEAWEQETWLRDHAAELSRVFSGYQGFTTDWRRARDQALAGVQEARDHQSAFITAREQLAQRYDVEALLRLPHAALIEQISRYSTSFWRFLKPSFKEAVNGIQATRRTASAPSTPSSTLSLAPSFPEILRDLETASHATTHHTWLQSHAQAHQAFGERFKGLDTEWHAIVDYITALADEAEAHNKKYDCAAATLSRYNLPTLLNGDLPALSDRFTSQYGPLVRMIEGDMARDIVLLGSVRTSAAVQRGSGQTASLHQWLSDLETARDLAQLESLRDNNREAHEHNFGRHYEGSRTEWPVVLAALETCRCIEAQRRLVHWESLKQVLIASGQATLTAGAQSAQLKQVLSRLQAPMKALHASFPLRDFPFSQLPPSNIALTELRNFFEQSHASFLDFFAAYDAASRGRVGASLETVKQDLLEAEAVEQERLALEGLTDQGQLLFGNFYTGIQTDWSTLLAALAWSEQFLERFGTNDVPEATLQAATNPVARDALTDRVLRLRTLFDGIEDDWAFAHQIFPDWEIGGRPADQVTLREVGSALEERVARIDDLDEWLAWQRLKAACDQTGLSNFWEIVLRAKPAAAQLEDAFWRRFWALWLDRAMRLSPSLAHFAGGMRDSDIERFRALDAGSLNDARVRLPALLVEGRPKPGLARVGEVAILQKEALKKTRHKALRALFSEIPTVLQALKPCLLMSPLSVAQFLDPSRVRFDVVIFDEASQICSEDAVGAVMRGTQLIVVGDRKQLPPSRYFGSSIEDEDEETEGGEVFESILDECATMGLTDKMLLWHYRSRSEDLIAFSNQHFYESNLVTFPGPNAAHARAVSFENVNGTYIRGKIKDARTNPIEARRVAELAIQHFETSPHESLGIIAFNEAQMSAIQSEVLRLVAIRPHLDNIVNYEGPDAFFIKNLENVQGDERDVILFSVGYGPDQNGKFSMNFGPLNRAGGERRLNVAVTRARLRVHVVASFEPDQIDEQRTSAQGPKLLAQYLRFAKHGAASSHVSNAQTSEGLEDVVARTLESRGWQVERSIGYSELRIDIAVRDPKDDSRFLLGIECDGPSYVSAKTARDRDRLRPQVLRSLGWTLLRLWSPDWLRNPEAQIARIEGALEEALNPLLPTLPVQLPPRAVPNNPAPNYGTQQLTPSPTVPPLSASPPTVTLPTVVVSGSPVSASGPANARASGASSGSPSGATQVQAATSPKGGSLIPASTTVPILTTVSLPAASPSSAAPDRSQGVSSADVAATQALAASISTGLMPGTAWYQEHDLPCMGPPSAFYDLARFQSTVVQEALLQIVEAEGPIRLAVAARRLVAGWGIGRVGKTLSVMVEDVVNRAQANSLLNRRDDFLWPVSMSLPPVRVPMPDATPRSVEDIAVEEVAQAAYVCVCDCYALSREDLLNQTARLLGFKQTGVNVRARIDAALQQLEVDSRLRVAGDTWSRT